VPAHLIDPETGFCHSHGPGARERMAARGRKGAEVTAEKLRTPGLDPTDLPPLNEPRDASVWLEVIGRACATGKLGHREAGAAVRAVETWLKSHDAGAVADQLTEPRAQLAALKRPEVLR